MGIFVLSGHRVLYRKLCKKKKNPFSGGLKIACVNPVSTSPKSHRSIWYSTYKSQHS